MIEPLKLTNQALIEIILKRITQIKIDRFDSVYIPFKSDFTAAITETIIEACKEMNFTVIQEYEVPVSTEILEQFKRRKRKSFTDFVIFNPHDKNLAIEVDSTIKKWSYKKLEILNEKGMDAFWFLWKRKVPGRNINSIDPIKKGLVNKNVPIFSFEFRSDFEQSDEKIINKIL